jgi:hypothetical protein
MLIVTYSMIDAIYKSTTPNVKSLQAIAVNSQYET